MSYVLPGTAGTAVPVFPGTARTASAVPLFHQSNNLFSIYSLVCYYPEYSRLNMPI